MNGDALDNGSLRSCAGVGELGKFFRSYLPEGLGCCLTACEALGNRFRIGLFSRFCWRNAMNSDSPPEIHPELNQKKKQIAWDLADLIRGTIIAQWRAWFNFDDVPASENRLQSLLRAFAGKQTCFAAGRTRGCSSRPAGWGFGMASVVSFTSAAVPNR